MPKREDINTVLVIGSGPIIIGQACEFDYSGTQACKALRGLGYKIVLVNSNPATIMTDPETADVTYIEPLNVERLTQIIEKERPDALLPNLGGQSALNLCSELSNAGVLDKYDVQVLGVKVDAIERGEDRLEFKKAMNELGIEMARSEIANTVDEALAIADKLGYPVVVRPAYTMGGAGGGLVYNVDELKIVVNRGLQASLVHQCLIEESILGWEELELEVVRDAKNNMITICFIENIDPLGVHTGDSFCSAPMLTISKEVQDRLQEQAYRIVESIGVIGGTNVQFAHDPVTDRIVVIEINPRTSRSSALASKATGFPIALVSAMLAAGLTLDEIPCGKYGTLDKYYPDGDYVVIKFARWAFEKFKAAEDKLGTQMKAVGEVMSIGKTYKEAFQKAIRSLETGRYGLGYAKNFNDLSKDELLKLLINPTSERQFIMYEALRKGATVNELFELTKIKHYFIEQMKELVEEEEKIASYKGNQLPDDVLKQAKKDGFADKYISKLLDVEEKEIRNQRLAMGMHQVWEPVHVSSTKDSSYYYSTYNGKDQDEVSNNKKIMILGGGPEKLEIPMPESGMAVTIDDALEIAQRIGYPLMVRPSYVLGGRGMEVVYDDESLKQYMAAAVGVTPDRPILIDRFLNDAMECEADAISDGENVFVPAVMEHIELAGIHSGDSACILPSKHIPVRHVQTIKEYTKKIAKEMNVRGLMNMQYAIADDKVYVLEANPRASRTVPLVSKVCNINMVKLATDIVTRELTGRPSPVKDLKDRKIPHIGVKQAVFPFNMFPEVDPILGPEMRSTGEVLGLANSYGAAIFKAEEATQTKLPTSGRVLISVSDRDKKDVVALARKYYDAGFEIVATGKTFELINSNNIPAIKIKKIKEGRPNIADALTNGELDMVINTPHGKESAHDDSYIRKTAIKMKIPYMTNIAAANAAVEGILEAEIHGTHEVKSLQEYHKAIKD